MKETYRVIDGGNGIPTCAIDQGVVARAEAQLAMSLMAAALSGNAKLGSSPMEVAEHVCNLAAASFKQFEKRGWLLELPDGAQMQQMLQKARQPQPLQSFGGQIVGGQR